MKKYFRLSGIFIIILLSSPIIGKSNSRFYKEAVKIIKNDVLAEAAWAMQQEPVTVTAASSNRSAGGKNDFFSEGDYWWPDPANPGGPYIQRDGMTNPDNFVAHRIAMIRFSRIVGALASAYKITHDDRYVHQIMLHCRAWFCDTATMMNPHLLFAQAISGRVTGRGIGIIDTIHLIEVVLALMETEQSGASDALVLKLSREWFRDYLVWLTTHSYGLDEMKATNNHGTCWVMQVAAFAKFTDNGSLVSFCKSRFKDVLMPQQLAEDGSFPLELKRTKPYGYSIFNLDAMATICQLLSTDKENLWEYELEDGRSIKKAVAFLFPFLEDKNKWPFPKDVMYWEEWPVAQPSLLFASRAYGMKNYFKTWKRLDHSPEVDEVIRNLPVRNPLLYFSDK